MGLSVFTGKKRLFFVPSGKKITYNLILQYEISILLILHYMTITVTEGFWYIYRKVSCIIKSECMPSF